MISRRNLNRSLASEKVGLVFYLVIERKGKRMLKPLKLDTKVSLKLVRAIADDTVIPEFYATLSRDLRERGVEPRVYTYNTGHASFDIDERVRQTAIVLDFLAATVPGARRLDGLDAHLS